MFDAFWRFLSRKVRTLDADRRYLRMFLSVNTRVQRFVLCGVRLSCSSIRDTCMELQLGTWLYIFVSIWYSLSDAAGVVIWPVLLCSPELGVYAYSAAQVKKAIEVGSRPNYAKCICITFFLLHYYIRIITFVSIGYTLPRWRKLRILGWSWRLSVSFEHGYGKRAESHGEIIMLCYHFIPSCFMLHRFLYSCAF